MTSKDITDIISIICPNDKDFEKAIISPAYLKKELEALTLEQEPYEDAISKQAVLDYIYNDLGLGDEENGKDVERQMELESSYRYIKSLPPVTPQPQTGHWIKYGKLYQCSICKELSCCQGKFCNECGTKMVVPQESEG